MVSDGLVTKLMNEGQVTGYPFSSSYLILIINDFENVTK